MDNKDINQGPDKHDLSYFFEPESIAIIGSFREGFFGGTMVVKTLINAGFAGRIYPVNPSYKKSHNLKVYSSMKEIPERVDLTLIMINVQTVPSVMEECAENGVRAVIIVADGFAERDREGARLQKKVLEIASQAGIRIIGPNTAGIVNTANGVNPCPYESGYYNLKQGSIALCSQTGLINPQSYPYPHQPFGVSKICDFGNKCDVDESDILEYLGKDPATKVISMHLENIKDGQRFLEVSKKVTVQKPVLILKLGKTPEGARASASHSGSLAVDDHIFDAVCKQAGILRIDRLDDLFEIPKFFAGQPLPAGNRLGIVTLTGAVGVLTSDEVGGYGLCVKQLTPETASKLEEIFHGLGKMPVDIGPMMANVNNFTIYSNMLNIIMADENVDCILNTLWAHGKGYGMEDFINTYKELKDRYQKPVVTWIYGPSLSVKAELIERLADLGFPVFNDPETAIKALGLAYRYSLFRKSLP